MVTACLSFHAPYRCRHAGACCAAPWQVRADEHVVRFVTTSGFSVHRATSMFVNQVGRDGVTTELSVAKGPEGTCVFREGRRCFLHARAGETMLPVGCRHYPRVVRIDPHRVALSLSHYCPTAASLLVTDEAVHVVNVAAPLAVSEPIEGLDARGALPPLLRPDLLTDVGGYSAWEGMVVETLARAIRPNDAMAVIAAATDDLRGWTPGSLSLEDAVGQAFARANPQRASAPAWLTEGLAIARSLNRGVVSIDGADDLDASWQKAMMTPAMDRILNNYLAARAFANWIAYQGRGLRTVVSWLHACYDSVRILLCRAGRSPFSVADVIEAIRQADYVMLHTIDTQDFANAARRIEE